MSHKQLADEFEWKDIMWYLEHPDELKKLMEGIKDDELTKGRIRSIYVRAVYGHEDPRSIAKYYKIPIKLVEDIRDKQIFQEIIGE